mmetsp:Transcript_2345/g.5386  ORF Transcript_2345/g.5386 Transcript_2345/m.5386 type:complete len:229 (-) Transcript_2345:622-1308(-)
MGALATVRRVCGVPHRGERAADVLATRVRWLCPPGAVVWLLPGRRLPGTLARCGLGLRGGRAGLHSTFCPRALDQTGGARLQVLGLSPQLRGRGDCDSLDGGLMALDFAWRPKQVERYHPATHETCETVEGLESCPGHEGVQVSACLSECCCCLSWGACMVDDAPLRVGAHGGHLLGTGVATFHRGSRKGIRVAQVLVDSFWYLGSVNVDDFRNHHGTWRLHQVPGPL